MADLPWTWLGIRASGITTWGLLTAVVLWGILLRTRLLGRAASPLRLLDLHRWLGAIALGFLVVHMTLLLCLLYTSPSPRDRQKSRMPSSA